jgi:hypothetical protein
MDCLIKLRKSLDKFRGLCFFSLHEAKMCVLSIRSSKIGHYKTKWEFKENSSSKTGPAKRMKEKRAKIFPAKIKKVRKVSFIQADLFYHLDCNRSVSSFFILLLFKIPKNFSSVLFGL